MDSEKFISLRMGSEIDEHEMEMDLPLECIVVRSGMRSEWRDESLRGD